MPVSNTTLDVLLVEDNPGDARLIRHHLNGSAVEAFIDGHSLTHEEDLSAGLAALDERRYDVLLLDLGLPESSGLETLDRVADHGIGIPVIVLTGIDDDRVAIEAIQAGAQDFLRKVDLDTDRLVRALRYAVERHEQERELRRKTEQMEFFNSILRHDMLNGMGVIRGWAETLEASLDGEEAERAATIVEWSDDIIELAETVRSTLDTLTGDDDPELRPVDLAPVVREAGKRAESMANGRDVTVEFDVGSGYRVLGDDLLPDVVGNVLTNAVEHTEDDVTVTVAASAGQGHVSLEIVDDGPGIDADDRERIFERDEKGTASTGTGFGLYFVASMLDTYGGDIRAEEADRGGARFVIELPRA